MILKADTNYSILNASGFYKALIQNHLSKINHEAGIFTGKSLFNKYIIFSDTEMPDKRKVIVSFTQRKDIEDIVEVDVSRKLIEITAEIIGETNEDFLKYSKRKLAKKNEEIVFYYMSAIAYECIKPNGEFNGTKAEFIMSNFKYKDNSTLWDKYASLIEYINNPSDLGLHELIEVYKGQFNSLSSVMTKIVNGDVPEYIQRNFNHIIQTGKFSKNSLKVAIALLNSNSFEEFITYMITRH